MTTNKITPLLLQNEEIQEELTLSWCNSFLNRHQDIKFKTAKEVEVERINNTTPTHINAFF